MSQNVNSTGSSETQIDLQGNWILPGFTDAHIHLMSYSQSFQRLRLGQLESGEILLAVKNRAERLHQNEWILGHGWELNRWNRENQPDNDLLDSVSPLNPVCLSSKDSHSVWMNTLGMTMLGYDDSSPDPPGGKITRDTITGKLNGLFFETAADEVIKAIPRPDEEQTTKLLKRGIYELHRQGITSVHVFDWLRIFQVLKKLDAKGDLTLRMVFNFQKEELAAAVNMGLQTGNVCGSMIVGSIKLFADGALGSRTALMTQPYTGTGDWCGQIVSEASAMRSMAEEAARHGIGTSIHAIGDLAVHNAFHALAGARQIDPELPGLRIEHTQMVLPEDIMRFSQLQIIASVQPVHLISDVDMAQKLWSGQTSLRYPYASIFNSGAEIIFGSDAPIEEPKPLEAIEAAVTRKRRDGYPSINGWGPEERMSVKDALNAVTINPAQLKNLGGNFGAIRPGCAADLTILEKDLLTIDPCDISRIRILMTLAAGQLVYSASGL